MAGAQNQTSPGVRGWAERWLSADRLAPYLAACEGDCERAVEMRASRIHCSLMVRTVCPECGAVGVSINRQTKMCPRCTERFHLEQERAFAEQLERERAEAEGGAEVERLRRERDALRQQNSRTCRKYGLKTRRQRGEG